MKQCLVFLWILLSVSLTGYADGLLGRAKEIRYALLLKTAYTSSDIELIEECAQIDSGFTLALTEMRVGQPISLLAQTKANYAFIDMMEKAGMVDDDNYRFALLSGIDNAGVSFDFERLIDYRVAFDKNISIYVNNADLKYQWKLLREAAYPDMLRINYNWNYANCMRAAYHYVKDKDFDNELVCSMAILVLGAMGNGTVYIENPEAWAKKLKRYWQMAMNGNRSVVDDIDFLEVSATLTANPKSFARTVELEQMVKRFDNRPREQIYVKLRLILAYCAQEEYEKANNLVADAASKATALAKECNGIVNPYLNLEPLILQHEAIVNLWSGDTLRWRSIIEPIMNCNYAEADLVTVRRNRFHLSSILEMTNEAIDHDLCSKVLLDCVNAEGFLPALAIGRVQAGMAMAKRGDISDGMTVVESGLELIAHHPMCRSITGATRMYQGVFWCYAGQIDSALLRLTEAEKYYVTTDGVEELFEIKNTLASYYGMNNDMKEARKYAEAYRVLRENSIFPPYSVNSDYEMQRILAWTKPIVEERIKSLERLANMAEQMGNYIFAARCYGDIGNLYGNNLHLRGAVTKANQFYEEALNIIVTLGLYNQTYVDDLVGLVRKYCAFLDMTGDFKRRYDLVYNVIAGLEYSKDNRSLSFIAFIGEELLRAVNNNNANEIKYYLNKIYNTWSYYKNLMDRNPILRASICAVTIPNIIVAQGWIAKNDLSGEKTLDEDELEDFIDDEIQNYGEIISDGNYAYTNLIMAKARYLIDVGRYKESSELLDTLALNPFYGGEYEPSKFAIPMRFRIAYQLGDYKECERLLEQAQLDGVLAGGQRWNINYMSDIMGSISEIKRKREDYEGGMRVALKRFDIMRMFIESQYAVLSESYRGALAVSGVATPNDIMGFLPEVPLSANCITAYDASLFYRNLLLESSNMQRRAVYKSGDSALIGDYETYLSLCKELAQTGSVTGRPHEEKIRIENIRARVHNMEADISQRCEGFENLTMRRKVRWKDVERKLGKSDAAIEFVSSPLPDEGDWLYGALIVRKGFKAPVYVPLMKHSALLEAMSPITTARKIETGVNRTYRYSANGKALYHGLWEPLEAYLTDGDRIYYATTGALSTVAFAAIEDSVQTPLCQRYDLLRMSTTAGLVVPRKKSGDRDAGRGYSYALFGDVTYDADSVKAASRRGEWMSLPQSATEINYIDSLCRESASISVRKFEREEASESRLRELAGGSPDVLLLSTHGFYFDPGAASLKKYYFNKGISNDSVPNMGISALLRGGVILSDANAVWNNEDTRPDESDGVLTAQEISELDLSETRLVVLSACETGLGEYTVTEGINGLQRGFKLAGAGSMIMSLWKVNDAAGSLFMRRLHDRMITDGMDRYTAFRDTRRELQEKYPNRPFLWAPFIMLD